MPEVFYVRHGESQANAEGIVAGWLDSPLTEKGVSQAIEEAGKIKAKGLAFDRIISSPLSRALKTVEIIADIVGYNKEIKIIDDLKEKGSGSFQGRPMDDLFKATDEEVTKAGGETFDVFAERVKRANQQLAQLAVSASGEQWLIGGHSAFYRMATCLSKGWLPGQMLKVEKPNNSELLKWPMSLEVELDEYRKRIAGKGKKKEKTCI